MEKEELESGYEKAIHYIYEKIQDGTFTTGSKLPTERALAEELGIGRNSTREALSILHGMGMIRRVQGSGNYLSGNAGSSMCQMLRMMLALGTITQKDVCEFRRTMEKSVAMHLLEHGIMEKESEEMEELLSQMSYLLTDEGREEPDAAAMEVECDKRFHDLLIYATGNTLFITLMEAVTEVYREWIDHILGKIDRKRKEELLGYHRSIYSGIRGKDSETVMAAIDGHYDLIEEIISLEERS